MTAANELPIGWTESAPGRLATNAHPTLGGIIDNRISDGRWFVIFNARSLAAIEGFATRADAFAAHAAVIRALI